MARCGAHPAPFPSDPQWPARRIFLAYLRACATKAGREMPGPKDIDTAYKTFQHQHPCPCPSEHETPNDGSTKQEEPTPSAEGWTPPTIVLLHKTATNTLPALSSETMPPGLSPNTTPRRPMYRQSDTMTRAYHARAGTAAQQPSILRGNCCTSSAPTTTPPPPPPPPTSKHGCPPVLARYPQATQHT